MPILGEIDLQAFRSKIVSMTISDDQRVLSRRAWIAGVLWAPALWLLFIVPFHASWRGMPQEQMGWVGFGTFFYCLFIYLPAALAGNAAIVALATRRRKTRPRLLRRIQVFAVLGALHAVAGFAIGMGSLALVLDP